MREMTKVIVLAFCLCCACEDLVAKVKFQPVVLVGDTLVVSQEPFDDAYKANVIRVLDFYKENYKLDDKGNILISRKKWEDRDLMWNYSNKAKNKAWLDSHKP